MTAPPAALPEREEPRAVAKGMARDSAWGLSASIANAALGMVQVAVFSRLLGPAGYGALALVIASVGAVKQFLSVRVWEWVARDFARGLEQRDVRLAASTVRAGLAVSATINVATLGVVLVLSPWIVHRFLHDQVGWHTPLVYCGTLAASWSYDACFAVLRTLGRFRFLAIQGVIATAVRVPFLGVAIVASGSLEVLLAAYVVYEGVWSAWLVWKTDHEFARAFGVSLRLAPSRSIREVVTEARSLLLVNSALDTVKLVTSRIDTLALGWFRPPSEVALYQAAFTFFDGLLRVQQQLYMVLFSHATRLAGRGDREGLLRLARSVGSLGLAAGAVIGAALAVGAPYFVSLVFGADYEASTPLLRWLALGALSCSGLWMQPLFVSMGRSSWGLAYNVALLTLKLALLGALTPTQGARGVAIAVGAYYGSVPLFGLGFYLRARAALGSRPGIDRDTASLLL